MGARRRLVAGALGLALLGVVAGPAPAATGRDGFFGYTWRDTADGAPFENVTPSPATTAPIVDDGAPFLVTLPFPCGFPFYGAHWSQLWVSDNGWVSVIDPAANSQPNPQPMLDGAVPFMTIAPFWNRLTPAIGTMTYGPFDAGRGWTVRWLALDPTGAPVDVELLLFADGGIRFQYRSSATFDSATVGIEGEVLVMDAVQIAAGGMVVPGVSDPYPGYSIEFTAPPALARRCATAPVVGCMPFPDVLVPGPANTILYGCSDVCHLAHDRLYALTLTEETQVSLVLAGTPNMVAFLLDGCDERACLDGPATSLSGLLPPGTYFISVDAPSQADEGPFILDVACTPFATPIACGDMAAGTVGTGTDVLDAYACGPVTPMDGPESAHVVDLAAPGNLAATLVTAVPAADLFILRDDGGALTGNDCVAWGDAEAFAWNLPAGRYVVVVDAPDGSAGSYELTLTCPADLACATPASTLDFRTGSALVVAGDNSSSPNDVELYACDAPVRHVGGEDVHVLELPRAGRISVIPVSGSASWFVMDACNEGTCLDPCGALLAAGTHYLVAEGDGGGGPYEAHVVLEDVAPGSRWSDCEDPVAPTLPGDTSSTLWSFDDFAFCVADPGHRNHPGGCTFPLYVAPSCGSEVHLGFVDLEAATVRVTDILTGLPVTLTAVSSTGFFQSGRDVSWQEGACPGGRDPDVDIVVDVFFDDPVSLCGVYRIDVENAGGDDWQVVANCDGAAGPLFTVHDSACSAIAARQLLPSLGFVVANAIFNCPEVTVTYAIENVGCAPAVDVPVTVLDDSGGFVAGDVVPEILPGQTVMQVLPFTVATGSVDLVVAIDPDQTIVECHESVGSGCSVVPPIDQVRIPGCPPPACRILADAAALPPAVCAGDPLTIDASMSVFSSCPGGQLEFRLTGPGAPPDWQLSPVFSGLVPPGDSVYVLEARCVGDPTCLDARSVPVTVEEPPTFDAPSVQAVDLATCSGGIRVSWSAATFHGAAGTGTYALHRSLVSCADALAQAPIQPFIAGTSYIDDPPTDTDVYYAVVAEDATPAVACAAGPNGGATTAVFANGGTCTAVRDVTIPDVTALPVIGGSLRARLEDPDDDTRVELSWTPSEPLDVAAGEHFHVRRSARPDRDFALIAGDVPLLAVGRFVDPDAGLPDDATHVLHYLVVASDACENEAAY